MQICPNSGPDCPFHHLLQLYYGVNKTLLVKSSPGPSAFEQTTMITQYNIVLTLSTSSRVFCERNPYPTRGLPFVQTDETGYLRVCPGAQISNFSKILRSYSVATRINISTAGASRASLTKHRRMNAAKKGAGRGKLKTTRLVLFVLRYDRIFSTRKMTRNIQQRQCRRLYLQHQPSATSDDGVDVPPRQNVSPSTAEGRCRRLEVYYNKKAYERARMAPTHVTSITGSFPSGSTFLGPAT